jgi:hypothetical protein
MTTARVGPIIPFPRYSADQRRLLLNVADLLLVQEAAAGKLRAQAGTPRFWKQADFSERVEQMIGEQAMLCERANLHREFALLVSGWPQAQEKRQLWTADLMVDSAASALAGIAASRAG